jgi:hypothetical protein
MVTSVQKWCHHYKNGDVILKIYDVIEIIGKWCYAAWKYCDAIGRMEMALEIW